MKKLLLARCVVCVCLVPVSACACFFNSALLFYGNKNYALQCRDASKVIIWTKKKKKKKISTKRKKIAIEIIRMRDFTKSLFFLYRIDPLRNGRSVMHMQNVYKSIIIGNYLHLRHTTIDICKRIPNVSNILLSACFRSSYKIKHKLTECNCKLRHINFIAI